MRNTNRTWNVAMRLPQIARFLCLRELMKPRSHISLVSTLDDKGKAQLNLGQAAEHKDLLTMRWWIVMSEGGRQQLRGDWKVATLPLLDAMQPW